MPKSISQAASQSYGLVCRLVVKMCVDVLQVISEIYMYSVQPGKMNTFFLWWLYVPLLALSFLIPFLCMYYGAYGDIMF